MKGDRQGVLLAGLALAFASCETPRTNPIPRIDGAPSVEGAALPQPVLEPPSIVPSVVVPALPEQRAQGLVLRMWQIDQAPTPSTLLWPNQASNVARVVPTLDLDLDVGRADCAAAGRRWMGEVEGQLEIALAGKYGFRIERTEGTRVYIDDVLVLGATGACELELAAGRHHCLLTTFSDDGKRRVALAWRPPGGADLELIPAAAWSHTVPAPSATLRGIKRAVERGVSAHAAWVPNPTLRLSEITLDAPRAPVAALAWIDDRSLLVATRPGVIWRVDGASNPSATRIASGLFDPRAIAAVGERVFVLQADELTELVDTDSDGFADAQRCACAAWSADRGHGYVATRLRKDGESLSIVLALRARPENSAQPGQVVLRYSPADGSVRRAESGPGDDGIEGEGAMSVLADGSAPSIDRGPYAGQWLGVAADRTTLQRRSLERVGSALQGCSVDLARGVDFDLANAARGPGGAWFAPPARASKANANTAFLQRLELLDAPCFDLLSVRAARDGLELEFTQPLAQGVGWEPENYALTQRALDEPESEPDTLVVSAARLRADRRVVSLAVELRENCAVSVRIVGALRSERGERLLNRTARYDLRRMPTSHELQMNVDPEALARAPLSAEQMRDGWSELFDSESLFGWHAVPAMAQSNWRLDQGVLAVSNGGADLRSDEHFGNFELSFEWRVSAGAASAVQFHVGESRSALVLDPSFELLDDLGRAEGRDPLRVSGACRDMYAPRSAESAPLGVWNRSRIVARDGHVEHWLDDVRIVEYAVGSDDWRRRAASLRPAVVSGNARGALVFHSSDTPVEFRAILVRRLESRP